MPTFKEVSSSWQARMAIFALVAVLALVAVSLGVPEAGGCGGAVPSSPRVDASSNLDSPTIKVDPPEAARSFRFSPSLSIAAAETEDGATRPGSATLITIDYQTGSLTTTGQNWSALIPGLKAGDYLVGMSAASQAMTYADGGGGGGGGYHPPPPPYWPYGSWITATHSCNLGQPNTGYVSWSAAGGGVWGYDVYKNGYYIGSTGGQSLNVSAGNGDVVQVDVYGADYTDRAGPSVTISGWPDCVWQPLSNGLPELSSVPSQLRGPGFASWYDERPSYSAELMPYLVGCALPEGSTLSFRGQTWTGELGLASTWTEGRFDAADQERVSACLMSRVNTSGKRVQISLRSDALSTSSQNRAVFWAKEAAWWGNVFVSPQQKNLCTMSAQDDGHRWFAADRGRVCDASNGFCGGIQDHGDCRQVCTGMSEDGHWTSCAGSTHPMTSFDRD